MLNLSVLLEHSARRFPDKEAIVAGPVRMTYAEADAAANQVANLLVARGIRPGDRVALALPNVHWFPVVYYGILKAGATVVPLNILLKPREIAYHLRDSGARAFVCFEGSPELPLGEDGLAGFAQAEGCELFLLARTSGALVMDQPGCEVLDEAVRGQSTQFESSAVEATDTAVILYTSGTTGQPKGAELTHANLTLNATTSHRMLEGREGDDIHLIALPLFHSFGQTLQMHMAFVGANTVVLMPRFDPVGAVRLMLEESVTFFAGVPTMYHGLLAAVPDGDDAARLRSTMRLAISGGSAMPVELLERVEQQFGIRLLEGYGLSETSPAACFTPLDGENRHGSIGRPIWGVHMKLLSPDADVSSRGIDDPEEVGEIAIKGHPVMKGYLDRPEETAAVLRDGWFRTGDLARRDADGYYYVVDRVKELIIRGGFNVYPREIEEVLMTHPAVSLVAVVGVPDERMGEEVKAFVIRTEGDGTTEDELLALGREQLAAYKYPRLLEFVPSLPMNATGKIQKRELIAGRYPADVLTEDRAT